MLYLGKYLFHKLKLEFDFGVRSILKMFVFGEHPDVHVYFFVVAQICIKFCSTRHKSYDIVFWFNFDTKTKPDCKCRPTTDTMLKGLAGFLLLSLDSYAAVNSQILLGPVFESVF